GYEYGIIFSYIANPRFGDFSPSSGDWGSDNVVKTTNFASGSDIIKYRALGMGNDGKFAVKLVDGGSGYLQGSSEYFMTPYLVIGGDFEHALYGASASFIPEAE
ncbi:MAG: hypothetical protein LBH54_05430, partial [Clostridiales bacterium]|nr:hypothetical protein [Clostridiales bacterium]